MLQTTRAIVLRTIKYSDSSVVADLLTESNGRLSFLVRLPKNPQRGKVKKQFFQPLTILELEFDYRQRSQLQHLREVRLAVAYGSIPFDAAKLSVVLFLAEFLYYSTREEQQNEPLFQYVVNSLMWLDTATHAYANFHLVFMMRLSRFIGFWPNVDDYTDGCCFDLRSATFTTSVPLHPDFLQPAEAANIVTLLRMGFETMHLFRLSRQERNRITDIILHYYRLHQPQMRELQSFSVVKELFA